MRKIAESIYSNSMPLQVVNEKGKDKHEEVKHIKILTFLLILANMEYAEAYAQ